ncbi:MAG: dephospho-CoA kinase, partial [Zetaproteobacteria bacterium CG_4_8_14_3_um_filter_59_5]
DLDALGRELHHDADCRAALLAAFGPGILDASGAVDRAELGRMCFADAEKTATLNNIMHPRIWQRERLWIDQQQAAYVLIEASVLIESGGASRMDAVVVVLADIAIRRLRVMQQRGLDAARFEAILARQCNDAARRDIADFIVENNAGMEELQACATNLHKQLLALCLG